MKKLLRFIDQFDGRDRIYANFLRHTVRVRNYEMAHTMLGLLDTDKYAAWRGATQDAVVRIAGLEGIDLSIRLGPQRDVSPLSLLVHIKRPPNSGTVQHQSHITGCCTGLLRLRTKCHGREILPRHFLRFSGYGFSGRRRLPFQRWWASIAPSLAG